MQSGCGATTVTKNFFEKLGRYKVQFFSFRLNSTLAVVVVFIVSLCLSFKEDYMADTCSPKPRLLPF